MTDLNFKQLAFVDKWVHLQKDEDAAISAGYKPGWGARLRKIPAIAAEIDRRMLILNTEQAKQTIKKRELNKDFLDKELIKVIAIKSADIVEKPALATPKLNAIEMGYRRIGVLAGGEFIPDQEHQQQRPDDAPRIYRATEASVITHRIETVQQVTMRETISTAISDQPPKSPYEF
jgi:hypothetical protein